MTNPTYFEASNGWQYRVSPSGFIEYRLQGEQDWNHIGTQVGLGFIEWAQSDIWMDGA